MIGVIFSSLLFFQRAKSLHCSKIERRCWLGPACLNRFLFAFSHIFFPPRHTNLIFEPTDSSFSTGKLGLLQVFSVLVKLFWDFFTHQKQCCGDEFRLMYDVYSLLFNAPRKETGLCITKCSINVLVSLCVYPPRRPPHWCWYLQGLNLIVYTYSTIYTRVFPFHSFGSLLQIPTKRKHTLWNIWFNFYYLFQSPTL